MIDCGLQGRVVLVTGGGSGIGEATCLAFGEADAKVVVLDWDIARADAVAAQIRFVGGEAVAFRTDVSDSASVDRAVDAAVDRYGRLDAIVNNAGTGIPATRTGDLTDDQWRHVLSINLDGVFYCTRAALRHMEPQGSGSIVNVASILGQVGSEVGTAAYTASKHAVIGLTKNTALEYAAAGVRVNAVGPGYVLTPLVEQSLSDEAKSMRLRNTPIGRFGRPEEIASLIMWLASDAAAFVTGSYYPADGGFLAR